MIHKFSDDMIEKSFDTFKIADSNPDTISHSLNHISHDSMSVPPALLKTNKSLLTRNKVAFFKKSLVLIKNDPNYEVAFKKSDLNKECDTVRLIFYINNKTSQDRKVTIDYEYESVSYQILISERLRQVNSNSQGR